MLSLQLVCYAYAGGPKFTVSSLLLKNITNDHAVGQLTQYLREILSCSLTGYMRLCEHPKTRNTKAENGLIFGREKNKTSDFEMWLTKAHKKFFEPGRLNGVFLRGHVDPSYLYLISLF